MEVPRGMFRRFHRRSQVRVGPRLMKSFVASGPVLMGKDLMDLSWAQRDAIATPLYKGDWRGAVALVPDDQKPALQKLCDEWSLAELAVEFDPLTEGVLVDAADYNGTQYAP